MYEPNLEFKNREELPLRKKHQILKTEPSFVNRRIGIGIYLHDSSQQLASYGQMLKITGSLIVTVRGY